MQGGWVSPGLRHITIAATKLPTQNFYCHKTKQKSDNKKSLFSPNNEKRNEKISLLDIFFFN